MGSSHRLFAPLVATGGLLIGLLAACSSAVNVSASADPASTRVPANLTGIHKIQHVIIVMQENHSFDNYFGALAYAPGSPYHNGFRGCRDGAAVQGEDQLVGVADDAV